MIFFLFLFQLAIHAQCIVNNVIEAMSPICAGSKAFVKGSVPTGGNGTFQYVWQVNDHDCGTGYTSIPGATGPNLIVPSNLAAKCIKRIVTSGGCTVESNKLDISGINPEPIIPAVKINGNASTNTGNITVTSPTGVGFTYSIDGVSYTNTTGIFTNVAFNTYNVSVKAAENCISQARNIVLSIEEAPTAPIVGTITQPTCATATGSVSLSGLPATGTWTLTRSPDGVATYSGTGPSYDVTNLPVGTYTFTVTDADGNVSAPSTSVTINAQPAAPAAPATSVVQPTCATATGTVTITSSTTGLQFSVDGGSYAAYPAGGYTLAAGAHTITARSVTDNTCISTAANVTVNAQPAAPAAPATSVVQPTCATATGTVTITSSTTGLQFSVDGGSYAAYPAGGYTLAAGAHTITARSVTDNTCISTAANVTVNAQPTSLPQPTASVTQQPTCATPTGTITITQPSPAAGITYSINGSTYTNTTGLFTGLAPGTYSVTARNGACTSVPRSLTVNAVPSSTLAATATTVGNLCGLNTGIITVSATGGIAPYTYSLNGGTPVILNIFAGLAAGTYNVTVRDAVGCSVVITPTVNSLNSTLTATANITNAPCGSTTGSAIISASGGNPPYTYSLDGGAFTSGSGFPNLSIGTHIVTVKDAPGCTYDVNVTISPSPTPVAPTVTPTQPTCAIATGTITVTTPAPASGITYSIDGINFTNTTGIFPGLAPTSYSVSYKNSVGCISTSLNVIITAQPPTPTQPVATVTTQPTCAVTTGTITITQPSPAAGISYSVDGVNYTNTTGVFNNLAPGSYSVTTKNSGGCISPALALTVNSVPALPAAPTVSVAQQPTCAIPTGNVIITSNTTGMLFSVDNGVFAAYPTGGYNFTSGNHNIRAKQISTDCISLATNVTVQSVPTPPSAPVAVVSQQPTCSTITGTVIVTSTTTGLEFSVDGGSYGVYPVGGYQLNPGSYTIRARSALDNGCVSTVTNVVVDNVPTAPTVPSLSITQPTCATPSGTVVITSSTSGLQYSVDGSGFAAYPAAGYILNPGSHTIVARRSSDNCTSTLLTFNVDPQPTTPLAPVASVSEQPNCTTITGTIVVTSPAPATGVRYSVDGTNYTNSTGVFTGLIAGTYPVTVRSAQGCVSPALNVVVNAAPSVPAQPTATVSQQPNCVVSTGTITITQPAPGAGITYSIDGTNYTNTTGIFTGLAPGNFIVTAKNAQGCVSLPRILTVNAPTASTLRASATAIDILCGLNTGTVTVIATGGLAPYTFSLNNATPVVTNIFTGLQAGSYTVKVTDAAGCFVEVTATVDLINSTLTATASITNIACGQTTGSAVISATGGNPPYTYSLDGGAFGSVSAFTGLAAGQHTVKVKDAPGCTYDVSVTIIAPAIPTAPTAALTQPTCTTATGTISFATPAPAAGITYSIDGVTYTNTTGVFTNVASGNYNLTYKNPQGCISNPLAVTVNAQPPVPLTPVASVSEQPNCTVSTGTITVTQPAPTTGLRYSVNGTDYTNATGVFTGLASGTYSVTVRNAQGCTSLATSVVINPAPPSTLFATAAVDNGLCDANGGAITVTATGGTAPYTYSLNSATPVSSNIFSALAAGSYNIKITDAAGCSFQLTATIQQPAAAPNLVITNPAAVCTGSTVNLKAASITAGSGNGLAYTYWKDAAASIALTDAEASAAVAGTYYIKATNQSGCFVIKLVAVTVSAITAGSITPANPAEVCNGETLVLTATTGVSFQWYKNDVAISGATGSTYTVTEAGTYNVQINNGTCTGKAPNPVIVKYKDCPSDVQIFVPTAFTPNNNRANDNLQPYFLNVRELKYFKVYNRWGQLVFETKTIGGGWDGTIKGVKQPVETYSWILECIDTRGNTIKKSGKSLLIR